MKNPNIKYYCEFHESHVNYLQNKLESEYNDYIYDYIEGTGNNLPDIDNQIDDIYQEIDIHRNELIEIYPEYWERR